MDLASASSPGELLPDVIAELARTLPSEHVGAWVRVLRSPDCAAGPGPATQARLIEARPGFALAGAATRLTRAWLSCAPVPSGEAVALALEAASELAGQFAAWRSDVVVSGPVSESAPVRLTSAVISELIHDSRTSLLVVSFAAFGVADVVRELQTAAQRGVRIDLIMEGTEAEGGALQSNLGAADAFAALRPHATFWTWPAARRLAVGGSRAALHAKLVAADDQVAIVGSANLTDRALARNIELGIIVRDPLVVRRMTAHFRSLMTPGTGPLQQAPGRR
jgi:cardiolipin synthase C